MQYSINDFPARLSPILVRELRAGIRSLWFLLGFVLLQFILSCWLVAHVSGSNASAGGGAATVIFWLSICVTFLVALPSRLFKSVNEEMKGARWEMLTIAGFTSHRMILSKWLATVAQSLIVWLSIMPFFVARFFGGGTNLLLELKFYFLVLAASWLLSAVVLYISSWKFMFMRIAAIIGLVWGIMICIIVVTESSSSVSAKDIPFAFIFSLAIVFAPAIGVLILAAAEKLSHPSENLGIWRVRFSIASAALIPVFIFTTGLWDDKDWSIALCIITLISTVAEFIVSGISDDPTKSITSRQTRKYAHSFWPKKMFGRLFVYQTKVRPQAIFLLLIFACSLGLFFKEPFTDAYMVLCVFISLLASIMLANAFSAFFSKNAPVAFWIFMAGIYALPYGIILMIQEMTYVKHASIEPFMLTFPPTMLGVVDSVSKFTLCGIAVGYAAVSFLITYIRERRKLLTAEAAA